MKRFTECNKWRDRWFYALTGQQKLLWVWLCDNCDNCGVVEPDWSMVKNDTGFTYSDEDLIAFGDRIKGLENGKHLLVKFVAFQYGKLSLESKPHAAVRTSLIRHGLEYDESNQRVSIGYSKGIDTLQEKEKDTDKDKEVKRVQGEKEQKSKATAEEMSAYCVTLDLPETDGLILFEKWIGTGWRNGGNPIKDWKATIRAWKAQGFMPSQKTPTKPSPPQDDGIYRPRQRVDFYGNPIPGAFE